MTYRPMRGDKIKFEHGNQNAIFRVDKIEPEEITVSVKNEDYDIPFHLTRAQWEGLAPYLVEREPGKGEPYAKAKARAQLLLQDFTELDLLLLVRLMLDINPEFVAEHISAYWESQIEGRPKFKSLTEVMDEWLNRETQL